MEKYYEEVMEYVSPPHKQWCLKCYFSCIFNDHRYTSKGPCQPPSEPGDVRAVGGLYPSALLSTHATKNGIQAHKHSSVYIQPPAVVGRHRGIGQQPVHCHAYG